MRENENAKKKDTEKEQWERSGARDGERGGGKGEKERGAIEWARRGRLIAAPIKRSRYASAQSSDLRYSPYEYVYSPSPSPSGAQQLPPLLRILALRSWACGRVFVRIPHPETRGDALRGGLNSGCGCLQHHRHGIRIGFSITQMMIRNEGERRPIGVKHKPIALTVSISNCTHTRMCICNIVINASENISWGVKTESNLSERTSTALFEFRYSSRRRSRPAGSDCSVNATGVAAFDRSSPKQTLQVREREHK